MTTMGHNRCGHTTLSDLLLMHTIHNTTSVVPYTQSRQSQGHAATQQQEEATSKKNSDGVVITTAVVAHTTTALVAV